MISQVCFYLLKIFQSPPSLVPFGLIACFGHFFNLEFPYLLSPIGVITSLGPILSTPLFTFLFF